MIRLFQCVVIVPALLLFSCKKDKPQLTEEQLPEPVVNSFTAQYPAASDVAWEVKKQKNPDAYENKQLIVYEADFKYNNQNLEARFDEGGNLLDEDK